jgi:hypothetical protein
VPERPTSWRTFLRAHWGAIAGADFFTTEVWTWRGLVTYYAVFVIDLASRRVQIVGLTPHPDEAFMRQVTRTLTTADDGVLVGHRVLICDRDAKWSAPVRARLGEAGIRIVQTPFQAPNANAYAERFVRSIKHECLNRVVPFGERHLRRTIAEFLEHYHGERNHQGLGNELIEGASTVERRPHSPSSASGRAPQLLRSRGVRRGGTCLGSAQAWNITRASALKAQVAAEGDHPPVQRPGAGGQVDARGCPPQRPVRVSLLENGIRVERVVGVEIQAQTSLPDADEFGEPQVDLRATGFE